MGRYDDAPGLSASGDQAATAEPPAAASRYDLQNLYPPPPPPPSEPQVAYRGTILPFTRYSDESVKFEPFNVWCDRQHLAWERIHRQCAEGRDFAGVRLLGETQMPH